MSENKPRENEFLKQNQASQFVKKSTDLMSKTIGGVFNNTAKAFNENAKLQIETNQILKRIDSSISSLNTLLSKNTQDTLKLQTKTSQFLQNASVKNKGARTAKDYVRRESQTKIMKDSYSDMIKLLSAIKKGGMLGSLGSLGGLGILFSGGGLLGYLMTGKTEFLFSVVKGFKYIGKGLSRAFKEIKTVGKVVKTISKLNVSTTLKAIKGIPKFFKGVFSVAKSISTIFSKGALTGFGKGLAKGIGKGSKNAFKKIPIIGGLIGLFFGIQRFKKKQWIEGLLEVASGVASIVPGVGTALAVAIDGFLLFKDFKGIETGEGSANEKFASGAKKFGKAFIRNLPGIGSIIRMKDAFTTWKSGKKLKALIEMGGAFASIIPGGGLLFDIAPKIVEMVSDSSIIKGIKNRLGGAKKFGKAFIRNLPGIGGIIRMKDAFTKWKSGKKLEALIEMGGAFASIIPGGGLLFDIAPKIVEMVSDSSIIKGIKNRLGGAKEKFASGAKKFGKAYIRNLPGIGSIIRMKDAFTKWKSGNKLEALKEMGGAFATIIPGGGLLFDIAPKIAEMVSDSSIIKGIKNILGGAKDVGKNILGGAKDVGKNILGGGGFDYDVGSKVKTVTEWGKRAFGKAKDGMFNSLKKPKEMDKGFNPIGYITSGARKLMDVDKSVGIKLYSPWNPNYDGLDPSMKLNFGNMAKEYFDTTGKDIQVNSAKRNRGGNSVHDYGFAIDINSSDANNLERMGLFKKYGFHRPLLNWKKMKEPWHVEPYPGEGVYGPRDTINNEFRKRVLMGKKDKYSKPEQGGGGFDINLPQGYVDGKFEPDKPMQVILSSDDIEKLANAFGRQLERNKPKDMPRANNQLVSGRKF